MSDSAVPRVLWALERVEARLMDLQLAEIAVQTAEGLPPDDLTLQEYRDITDAAYRAQGRTEGLSAAMEVVAQMRREYALKHGAVGRGHQARVLAALMEEGPAAGGG